jgi:hypothetical protein
MGWAPLGTLGASGHAGHAGRLWAPRNGSRGDTAPGLGSYRPLRPPGNQSAGLTALRAGRSGIRPGKAIKRARGAWGAPGLRLWRREGGAYVLNSGETIHAITAAAIFTATANKTRLPIIVAKRKSLIMINKSSRHRRHKELFRQRCGRARLKCPRPLHSLYPKSQRRGGF